MMTRSVVVQQHPRRHWRRAGWIALLLGIGFLGGIWFSIKAGFASVDDSDAAARQLRQEVSELQQWREDHMTRRDIDAKALEMVRSELASQHETIAELERGIHLYKSLMSPADFAEGLHIHSVEFTREGQSSKYQFRVLVQQQSAGKNPTITGILRVWVAGHENGQEAEYNISKLSKAVPRDDIRLRFRYFQEITGELLLPDGFAPQSVRALVTSIRPRQEEVAKQFPWAVQERIGYVRQ